MKLPFDVFLCILGPPQKSLTKAWLSLDPPRFFDGSNSRKQHAHDLNQICKLFSSQDGLALWAIDKANRAWVRFGIDKDLPVGSHWEMVGNKLMRSYIIV